MPDRLADLISFNTRNGIDFIEIANSAQTELRVHFLTTVVVEGTLVGTAPVTITGGETVATVPVEPIVATDWTSDDAGRPVLTVRTPFPGDFSHYRLAIAGTALDPFYAGILFTFKAGCPSTLDCAEPCDCETDDAPSPVIDYLAKDFESFRGALLDYAASAYPQWVERDEPDVGMMLVELLSAVGDDLSYLQDRITGEATLATATQHVSAVRHARLVDYEPTPARSSRSSSAARCSTPTRAPCARIRSPSTRGGTAPTTPPRRPTASFPTGGTTHSCAFPQARHSYGSKGRATGSRWAIRRREPWASPC
jgi:hypothetical protein